MEIAGKRHYQTPAGVFESVTTRLSVLSKDAIEQWKERIGREAAAKISQQAGVRGTIVHNIIERYLSNDGSYRDGVMPFYLQSFNLIKKVLDINVGIVYGQEFPLYSSLLKTAGTADLICEYNGKKSVADFKTSLRIKHKDHILSYFWQATAYAIMMKELYDYIAEQIVIIIAPDDEAVQIFIAHPDEYRQDVINFFN